MGYIDITKTLCAGMKKYPSDPAVGFRHHKAVRKGDSCNLYKITMGSHAGTHIDAPRHLFDDGAGVDDIKPETLICDVIVVEGVRSVPRILAGGKSRGIGGLIVKCGRDGSGLDAEIVKDLLRKRIRVVGTDRMSIEGSSDKSHPVHRLLLKSGIVIIESLDLRGVKPGRYKLICLPLKIKGGDGAPARAILTDDKSDNF